MKVRIQIDTQTFVRFWLVVIGFALAILLMYLSRVGLIILGSALFLSLALNGPVTRLAKHMPSKSRVMSTFIAFVLIVSFIGAFIFLAVPPIVQQTAKVAQTLPSLVDSATESYRSLDGVITQYNLRPQVDSAVDSLRSNVAGVAANFGGAVLSSLGSIAAFLAALLLVLVLSILMLIEGPDWMRRIWGLYQDEALMKRHRNISTKIYHVVADYVVGQLAVSGLGAIASGLAVFILSFFFEIPANLAIPIAALTFVLSLIPMFGATVAGALAALLLLFNSPGAAIAYVVFFVIYQQVENNFVSPTIQSKKLSLSPLAVLASVTIGLYLFGIAGGIISSPIAGAIKVLIEDYLEHADKQRKKERTPMRKLAKKVTGEHSSSH